MVNFFLNIFDINDLFINLFIFRILLSIFILTLTSLVVEKTELIDIFYFTMTILHRNTYFI